MENNTLPQLSQENSVKEILLDSNKRLDYIGSVSAKTNGFFESFIEIEKARRLKDIEDKAEVRKRASQVAENQQSNTNAMGGDKAGFIGLLGKLGIGAAIGSIGAGIGAAMPIVLPILAVAGVLLGSVKILEGLDTEQIKTNVNNLLSIGDGYDSSFEMLGEAGDVTLALTGLGIGLAAFGIGSAANAAVSQFLLPGWSEVVKQNVETLLSIGENVEIIDTLRVTSALGSLGTALTVFAIGSGAAAAIDYFTSSDFGYNIKKNVENILSISGENNAARVAGDLAILGAGLATFAVGNASAGILNFFNGENVDNIVGDVNKLFGIRAGGDIEEAAMSFNRAMRSISAGLITFSAGNSVSSTLEAGGSFLDFWAGENSTIDEINRNVGAVINVVERVNVEKSEEFKSVMGNLSSGLIDIAGGTFVNSVSTLIDSFFSFFRGDRSPMQMIFDIADRSNEINTGANALHNLATALNALGNFSEFNGVDFDFKKFATDLADATVMMDAAIHGGSVNLPGVFNDFRVTHGLAENTTSYEAAAENIKMIINALSPFDVQSSAYPTELAPIMGPNLEMRDTSVQSYARAEDAYNQSTSNTSNRMNAIVDNRVTNNSSSSTTMMIPQAPTIDLLDGGG